MSETMNAFVSILLWASVIVLTPMAVGALVIGVKACLKAERERRDDEAHRI